MASLEFRGTKVWEWVCCSIRFVNKVVRRFGPGAKHRPCHVWAHPCKYKVSLHNKFNQGLGRGVWFGPVYRGGGGTPPVQSISHRVQTVNTSPLTKGGLQQGLTTGNNCQPVGLRQQPMGPVTGGGGVSGSGNLGIYQSINNGSPGVY